MSTGCAADAGPAGPDEPLTPSTLGISQSDLDPGALAIAQQTPEPELEGGADAQVVDKIRNGTSVDYDFGLTNGLVLIRVGGLPCTAQVINRYFLLTAAHCVMYRDPGFYERAFNINVQFTTSAGPRKTIYDGDAYATMNPDWVDPENRLDLALIYLPNRITTCNSTIAWCKANRPDVPINAQLQYFDSPADRTLPVNAPYLAAAYGGTDDYDDFDNPSDNVGLRANYTLFDRFYLYTDARGGLLLKTKWLNGGSTARMCNGDSGSPLLPVASPAGTPQPSTGRPFHTGVLSGSVDCLQPEGFSYYVGLDTDRASWVLANLALFSQAGLGFTCSGVSSLPSEVYAFQCAN